MNSSQNEALSPSGKLYPSTDLAQLRGTLFGFHPTAVSQFSLLLFSRISNFFDLSITEET
jgi:hypothetical protein